MPLELIYLKTGIVPIRYILKAKRLSYLRNNDELISRVYCAQKRKPVKDNWYLTVQNDLKELSINN